MGALARPFWADEVTQGAAPPICIGADIGQQTDPTAIVVAEVRRLPQPQRCAFTVRHLERLPLGTAYPQVAKRLAAVVANLAIRPVPALMTPPRLLLTIDATGVGRPVVDLVRDALAGTRCTLTAATFTHGDRLDGNTRELRVGKAYLVSRLQALFQTGRLQLPAGHPEAEAMLRELLDYEIKVSEDANDRYGAFKTGAHDDLVTALGLAVLKDPYAAAVVAF